ncbi:hypothetical protein ACE3MQ_25940 [Paenibacillus lentus]|uniref:hypothetical protein n=1 Tax=Paenibacillus lentus TaxID=1338368 RepID=UPI00365AE80E
MRKRRSKWGLRLFLLLLIVFLLAAAAVWYIRPERPLDMSYSKIAWKDKLTRMIETRKPEIELSEEEFNDLAKQKLAQALESYELPVTINGMQFQLAGDLLTVHIHAEWGSMEIGAAVQYSMGYSAGRLVLNPEAVKVRMLSLSPAIFGLEQVEIDPAPYVPDPVAIENILFHDRHITIKFTLDWLEIARYLSSY